MHAGFYFATVPTQTQTKTYNQQAERALPALMSTTSPNRLQDDITTDMPAAKDGSQSGNDVEISNGTDENRKDTTRQMNNVQCETDNDEKPLQIDTGCEMKNDVEINAKDERQTNGSKRSSDNSETNPTPTKKARPKPKPMKIDNMKEYVDNNTIEKLTTTTLFHWLKERNLHCSTRDKKADLIEKIKKQFITSTS